jgi:hypothetical protein
MEEKGRKLWVLFASLVDWFFVPATCSSSGAPMASSLKAPVMPQAVDDA